jgi:hypothetical protein
MANPHTEGLDWALDDTGIAAAGCYSVFGFVELPPIRCPRGVRASM